MAASASPVRVDALVLTALQDELSAFLRALSDSQEARDEHGFRFHIGEVASERGGTLSIAAAWIGEMGPQAAAARAATLVNELNPACLAMCGICAGKRGEVSLGDVIVASQVYAYDRGKLVAREQGEPVSDFYSDITTYNLEKRWAMDAAYLAKEVSWIEALAQGRPIFLRSQLRWLLATLYAHEARADVPPKEHEARKVRCPDWARVVAKARAEELVLVSKGQLVLTEKGRELAQEDELLFPDGLPEDPPLRVHVGPIATGGVVQEDPLLFDRLSRYVRKTLGVEMEAAAIGYVGDLLARRSIVVKAVSDHADHDKDDHFRAFACFASASWLLSFLRRYLEPTVVSPENRPSALPPVRAADAELAEVALKLETAIARRNKLRAAKADTTVVDREILGLRRQLREGGVLRVGDSLGDGRYLLLEEVGQGGFARVWRARDREAQEDVAIKVLRSDLANDPARKERFFRGARMMVELGHPHVVRVLEQRGEDGGFFWFVMEYVSGGDLRAQILSSRLAPDVALGILLAVSDVLAAAHQRGYVHRDVKPANVLLHADGKPRLTDFDLVAAADTTGGTRSGAMGTFLYAAPECLHKPQDATPRADVYGLGMTAVFALYGQELPLEVVRDAKRFIERLDCAPRVKEVLIRATAWEASERYADAGAFRDALRDALSAPQVALPEPPKERAQAPLMPVDETGASVTCLAFSSNGRRLVSGHQSGQVYYVRTSVGHRNTMITSPMQHSIVSVCAFGDALSFFVCSSGGHFLLWAPEENRMQRWGMIPRYQEGSPVSVHPSGRLAAFVDGKIHVYAIVGDAGLSRIAALEPGGHKVTSLGFSQDAQLIYAGFPVDTVRIYSVETGALEAMNTGPRGNVTKIVASGDGKLVASLGSSGRLKVNAATSKRTWATLWSVQGSDVRDAAFGKMIQNGKETAAVFAIMIESQRDARLFSYDAESGRALMSVPVPQATCLAASPTKDLLAVGRSDGTIVLVDSKKQAIVQTFWS